MDKFLEKHNLPRLNQEETKNLNRPIPSTGMKTVMRNLLPYVGIFNSFSPVIDI